MFRECQADLSMIRVILGDGYYDESVYTCRIIRYIPEKECVYLLTGDTELSRFSLDAIYECSIQKDSDIIKCQGFLTERYKSKLGNVVVMKIQNGFYKNPVN